MAGQALLLFGRDLDCGFRSTLQRFIDRKCFLMLRSGFNSGTVAHGATPNQLSVHSMKNYLFLIAGAAVLTGCGSIPQVGIDAGATSALANKTVAHTLRPVPTFSTLKPGAALLGAIGAVSGILQGNGIISTNKVHDPAVAVSRDLLAAMESKYGVRRAPAFTIDSGDATAIAAVAKGKADYVLDVATTVWSVMYFPTDWTHYRINHIATARLIDVSNGKVLASDTCSHMAKDNVAAPTWDEMMADQAAWLKAELDLSADECVAKLKTNMLRL
jgi:hypothetical protein